MIMDTIKLEIITPSGKIFSEDVVAVTLPGSEGEFGVLPGHASLVSLLSAGVIEVEIQNKTVESVAVDWGYVEVTEGRVTALVDGAVAIKGDTESQIAESLSKAKQLLREAQDSSLILSAVEAKIEATARGSL
jgi:F-type H+-transporting ATPase subunit epsilon